MVRRHSGLTRRRARCRLSTRCRRARYPRPSHRPRTSARRSGAGASCRQSRRRRASPVPVSRPTSNRFGGRRAISRTRARPARTCSRTPGRRRRFPKYRADRSAALEESLDVQGNLASACPGVIGRTERPRCEPCARLRSSRAGAHSRNSARARAPHASSWPSGRARGSARRRAGRDGRAAAGRR